MKRFIFCAVLTAMLFGPTAEASVVYTFNGDFSSAFDFDSVARETSQASFSITTVNPITAAGFFSPDANTSSITGLNSGGFLFSPGGQEIYPNGFLTGLVYVGLNLSTATGGGGTFYYFFDDGALLADGTYETVTGSIVGVGDFGPLNLGNAGVATLVVSGIDDPTPMPEPMSLALVGVALVGLATTRRRAV